MTPAPAAERRLRWALLRVLEVVEVGGLAIVIAVTLATVMVLRPRSDHPTHADAIVVLSGDHGERIKLAQELLRAGVARTLILDGTPDLVEDLDLCKGGQPFDVICLHPEPDSTRAEARALAQLASRRHWDSITVVTSTPHVSRSRLLFSRCFPHRLDVVGAALPYGGAAARKERVHEVVGLLYAKAWAITC